MNDRTGELFGAYRLIRLLDSGGFADVYLAEYRQLQTHQAIKILQMLLFEADEQQKFLQEARLLAHLKHPHIIQVLDFGFESQQPFLVMTYAPRGSVRQQHPPGTRVPPDVVVSYVNQVASALHYVHEQGLIHRDIKPENLLVGENSELLLSDFGIAIIAHSSRSQSLQEVIGTTTYMAPEQIKGRPRPASDQYALAVLAYEWLAGAPPFQGETDIDIARQHLLDAPPPLFQRAPDVPPALAAVIARALHKDYRQRFASVQDFATALEDAQRTGALPAPPTDPERETETDSDREGAHRERAPGERIPRRAVIGMFGAGAATLAIGGTAGWLALSRQGRRSGHIVLQPRPTPVRSLATATPTQAVSIGQLIYTFTQHDGWVDTVDWSPDSRRIVSCDFSGLIRVWDAFSGDTLATRDDFLLGYSDPDQRFNVAGDFNRGVAWSPDGQHIASNSEGNAVAVWQLFDGAGNSVSDSGVLAWSPDGTYLAVGNFSGAASAQVYNRATGELTLTYYGHMDGDTLPNLRSNVFANTVSGIAWAPDGQHIVTCGGDNTVQVWNAFSGARVSTYTRASLSSPHHYPYMVWGVAWSPDGKAIASAWNGDVDITDPWSGQLLTNYHNGLDSFSALAWSPDSTSIALAGSDGAVYLWQVRTKVILYSYRGHSDAVTAVAWSPDGRFVASGGADRTVQIWKAS